jgi:alkylation response protein AidB-like acyl-CoA dehydrogenase
MRFALTVDQAALRDALRDLLARECPPAVVRQAWPGGDRARVDAVWARLAEMGVIGAAVPEDAGGLGLGATDVVALLEETGRAALPQPIVETAFVAGPLLAAAGDPGGLLADLIDGALLVAWGEPPLVAHARSADVLLLDEGSAVRRLARGEATVTPVESIDGSRGLGRVDPAAGETLNADFEAIAAARDRGALGTAAQLVGLARRMIEMTTGYVAERRQFGVPIGSFQAVKHQLAGALLAVEFAAPAVARAAWSIDTNAATAGRDVSMAKALASEAAERVAQVALQCHGAIAYTVEYDLHLWLKRAWALAPAWGSAEEHRARVGAALGL